MKNEIKTITIDDIRDLRRRGLNMEARDMLNTYHKVLGKNRKEEKEEVKKIGMKIYNKKQKRKHMI